MGKELSKARGGNSLVLLSKEEEEEERCHSLDPPKVRRQVRTSTLLLKEMRKDWPGPTSSLEALLGFTLVEPVNPPEMDEWQVTGFWNSGSWFGVPVSVSDNLRDFGQAIHSLHSSSSHLRNEDNRTYIIHL